MVYNQVAAPWRVARGDREDAVARQVVETQVGAKAFHADWIRFDRDHPSGSTEGVAERDGIQANVRADVDEGATFAQALPEKGNLSLIVAGVNE